MNKLDKNKHQERAKVEPLGDLKIDEARGILLNTLKQYLIFNIGFLEQMKKDTSETITKIRANTDAAEN